MIICKGLYIAEPGESLFGEAIARTVACNVVDKLWEDCFEFLAGDGHCGRLFEEVKLSWNVCWYILFLIFTFDRRGPQSVHSTSQCTPNNK